LILGETDHFILGVIRNLCALSATVSYARRNNNRDHSPQRQHGFTPKVATTPAKTGHNKAAVGTSAISRIDLLVFGLTRAPSKQSGLCLLTKLGFA
jgi:hypothetical protein